MVSGTPDDSTGPTTSEGRLGRTLRHSREAVGMSVRMLALRAGFSPSFVSQIENGQASPSLASLTRIAAALGVTLADLFAEPLEPVVIKAGERPAFTSAWSGARIQSLCRASGQRTLDAVVVTFEPGGSSGRHPVGSLTDQVAFIVDGPVVLTLQGSRLDLQSGDAVTISRGTAHHWQNDGPQAAEIVLVGLRLVH